MAKYYHFTSYDNLESINKNGLVPQIGSRTKSVGDKRNAIFLSKGIINTILMYSDLLYYYNSYDGNGWKKLIRYYKNRIKSYREMEKEIPLDDEDIMEIEATVKAIERAKEMGKYNSFSDYIGNGVYLSISDITDVNSDNFKDCYTNQAINPQNIKVVVLKNRITGDITDFREDILAYFMSITPINDIINITHNVITIKVIKELYINRVNDIIYYNSDNFEIEEIPIDLYIKNNMINERNNKKR